MLGVQTLGPITPRCVADRPVARVAEGGASTAGRDERPERIGCAPDGGHAVPAARDAASSEGDRHRERDAWAVLLSVSGLGPVGFAALLRAFGSARAALAVAAAPDGPARLQRTLADLPGDLGDSLPAAPFDACALGATEPPPSEATGPRRQKPIGDDLAVRICEAVQNGSLVLDQIQRLGLAVVTLEDPGYPDRLRAVELPPPLLFVRGSTAALSLPGAVAVVGTRRPTDKGRLVAGWIGSAIARTGAAVVSGLAVGIDGAAHAAVVSEGGRTVAVLGGGHARMFPKAHERLADTIVEAGGAVVSELRPDTCPTRGTFPRRNRLVSGLSDATIVVEAGRRSGALITAGWALEQGRECFLVPGPLDAPASAGCLAFLRSFPGQARVVCGVAELIEDLGLDVSDAGTASSSNGHGRATHLGDPSPFAKTAGLAATLAALGPVERTLAEELTYGPATADQLALRTALPDATVLSALTLLELRGLVASAYGRYAPRGELAGWPGAGSDVRPDTAATARRRARAPPFRSTRSARADAVRSADFADRCYPPAESSAREGAPAAQETAVCGRSRPPRWPFPFWPSCISRP